MIDHLGDLCGAGLSSLKIEGRAKSAYYAAIVTGAYRHCLDAAAAGESVDPVWRDEVLHPTDEILYGPSQGGAACIPWCAAGWTCQPNEEKRGEKTMNADVVIVGAGPAGIFTALEMIKKGSRQKIVMVEKGQPVEKRHCPKDKTKKCINCKPYCHITTGFSGAGAFPTASCLSAMRWAAICPP